MKPNYIERIHELIQLNNSDKDISEIIKNEYRISLSLNSISKRRNNKLNLHLKKSKYFTKINSLPRQVLKKKQPRYEPIFDIEKPSIILKKFKDFITKDFKILKIEDEKLNELIKIIVRDNLISDTEKKFLQEKTKELNLPKDLLKESTDYLFSNNPYLDNVRRQQKVNF